MRTDRVQLIIDHQVNDSVAVISLAGRLMLGPEGAQLETLVRKLLTDGVRKFIFDFAELTHIDSTGIGRCIASLNLIMEAGAELRIAGATGQVREAFRITQLDRVFQFHEDLGAAESSLV